MDLGRLDRRRTATITLLAVSAVMCVVALVTDSHRLSVVNTIVAVAANPFHTPAQAQQVLAAAQNSDATVHTVTWLTLGVTLLCGVAFIRWFREAYRNTAAVGAGHRYSLEWATWSWIVPFLSLVRPKQIADDIWEGSQPAASRGARPTLLHWWWAAWVLAGVVAAISRFSSGDTLTVFESLSALVGHIRNATHLDMAYHALELIAAALAACVVQTVTARQHQRAAEHTATLSAPPALPAQAPVPTSAFGEPAVPSPAYRAAPTPTPAPSATLWQGWGEPPTASPPAPEMTGSVPPPSVPPPGFPGT